MMSGKLSDTLRRLGNAMLAPGGWGDVEVRGRGRKGWLNLESAIAQAEALKAEVEHLEAKDRGWREFRSAVCNAVGNCTSCLPAGETWAATDDSVVQYVRDIVAFAQDRQAEVERLEKAGATAAAIDVKTERWICNVCALPCRVEIETADGKLPFHNRVCLYHEDQPVWRVDGEAAAEAGGTCDNDGSQT